MRVERALSGARLRRIACCACFDAQPIEWREGVLPSWCRARVAVEAAHPDFWRKYVGLDGEVIGIDRFGASAPAPDLFEHFGITVDAVVDALRRVASLSTRNKASEHSA